jgi:hypothetical protein
LKGIIKTTLKLVFAGAIIYWLVQSDKLDFSLIGRSFKQGNTWLYAFLLLIVQTMLLSYRWLLLLEINSSKKLSFFGIVKVTWIGLFFNTFLPGAVTGDLVKLVYAKDLDPNISKTYLVTSVFIDRVIGLSGLLVILGLSSIFYYETITAISPQMKTLIHFNLFLFVGAVVLIFSLFAPKKIQELFLKYAAMVPVLGKRIHKTLIEFWTIGKSKSLIFKTIGLSIAIQHVTLTAFYSLTSPFYGKYIPMPYIITFIPVGFLAVAVPISPAGVGIGHAIFDKLFNFINVSGGASLFNLYFLLQVSINLLGIFPYLFSGKKHQLSETEEFELAEQ